MKTQALLGVVTIAGLWSLSLCVTHQYHFVNIKVNWTDAQQYCRDKFTDLATVPTLEDVNTLDRMVDGLVWIGLYNDVTSWTWRWSLADERFYKDAEEHQFSKWAHGEPSNPKKLCAFMSSNGTGEWRDGNCAIQRNAICFDDTEPKYIITTKYLTWSEAQRECREKHTDLASVRNQAENQEIQKILLYGDYWIGLFRDSWKWSDGSSSSFRHWAIGEPDSGPGACAGGRPKWGDWKCDKKHSFICYSAPVEKHVLRVKLTINSSLDVNDPAVQEAILEQMKQKMKDHQGAPADIKVRWVEQADGRIFHKEDKKKKRERKPVLTKSEL